MLHRLCGPPSIPLSFNLAVVLPRWITYCVNSGTEGFSPPTPSNHRLQRGLPGYLILFATHAFAPQRQFPARLPPSLTVFLLISTHFTATPGILQSSLILQYYSITSLTKVELQSLTNDLQHRLRALYAQSLRTTLAPSVLPRLLARSQPGLLIQVPSIHTQLLIGIFFPVERTLRPEGLRHSRGVAASLLRALRKIPHCCLPQESGPCLSPSVAGHPLRPATHRRLGRPLPSQLANGTRVHLSASGLPNFSYINMHLYNLSGISSPFGKLFQSKRQVTHVLLTRAPV